MPLKLRAGHLAGVQRWKTWIMMRKRGVEFKGGSLHDGNAVLTVLVVLGDILALLLSVLQNTAQ